MVEEPYSDSTKKDAYECDKSESEDPEDI